MSQEDALTKLRIRIGQVEVEYEGTDEFLRKELPELLKAVLELHGNVAQGAFGGAGESEATGETLPKGTPISTSTVARPSVERAAAIWLSRLRQRSSWAKENNPFPDRSSSTR